MSTLEEVVRIIDAAALANDLALVEAAVKNSLPDLHPFRADGAEVLESDYRRAATWAFEYDVAFERVDGKERIVVDPAFVDASGWTYPPRICDAPTRVVSQWREMAALVLAPYAKSRLEHLLFIAKVGNGRDRAMAAAKAYVDAAEIWEATSDRIAYLALGMRLARSVGQRDFAKQAAERIGHTVGQALASEPPIFAPAVRGLRILAGEPNKIARLDRLLKQATERFTSARQKDQVIDIRLDLAAAADRTALWTERVGVWISAAEEAAGLIRAAHLQAALGLAERSGNKDLVGSAAAALQKVRLEGLEDLGLMKVEASSKVSDARARSVMAPIAEAESWQEALDYFSQFGPLTGSLEKNQEIIGEQMERLLSQRFPMQTLGADNMPRYFPQNEADKFDMALARQEAFLLQGWSPFLERALFSVATKHGIPTEGDLASYFSMRPVVSEELGHSIARAFLRFWTGDFEGAALAAAPRIETVARELMLGLDVGLYRLQREQKPGQYAGLSVLLAGLVDRGLDKSWYRFIYTLCANPAGGPNLRNDLLHGFVNDVSPTGAAYLLQALAYLINLIPGPSADGDDFVTPENV